MVLMTELLQTRAGFESATLPRIRIRYPGHAVLAKEKQAILSTGVLRSLEMPRDFRPAVVTMRLLTCLPSLGCVLPN
jgi:hypothetical protein